ncbi:MAG: hypothetical protein L0241_32210 [Planctomycetia bacterium]|nr:hypothetical protein [Planctomycetia bacterium]
MSYSAFVESENVSESPSAWLSPTATSLDTLLYLLPRDFSLIPIGTLLRPIPSPELPTLPEHPDLSLPESAYPDWYLRSSGTSYLQRDISRRQSLLKEAHALQEKINARRRQFAQQFEEAKAEYAKVQRGLVASDLNAAERIILFAHQRHPLPQFLRREYRVVIVPESKVALIEFKFPDYSDAKLVVELNRFAVVV